MSPCQKPSSTVEDRTSLLYFDTSALIKAIIDEPGTATVRSLFEDSTIETACGSALQQVELRSAVVMRLSRRELSSEGADQAFQAIDELLSLLTMIPVSESILREAAASIKQTRLRSLDSIQLSTALSIARLTGSPLTFVAADKRLIEAAHASGLATLNPE